MGMAAGLLSIRGVEYPEANSWIFQDIFPLRFSPAKMLATTTTTDATTWATRADRSSLLLIISILYTAVNSTYDFQV